MIDTAEGREEWKRLTLIKMGGGGIKELNFAKSQFCFVDYLLVKTNGKEIKIMHIEFDEKLEEMYNVTA